MTMKHLGLALMLIGLVDSVADGQWQQQNIDTDSDFRGLSVVDANIAWVSGTKGTFGRTTNAGETWTVGIVPNAGNLDFRDVKAFGESTAYLLSAGPGDQSRIYKTTDGGKKWTLQFKNADRDAFFDAMAFWNEKDGVALGDPVNGRFQLIVTENGGGIWKPLVPENMPPTLPNEGAFAASGSCLITFGTSNLLFVTGGAATARVFHSTDRGRKWVVTNTPIQAGVESAGIFSIAFRDRRHGIIVGGDYRKPETAGATAAITRDGNTTWTLLNNPFPYRSCVAWARDRWIAVGTSGSDYSLDGTHWKSIDRASYNTVGFTFDGDGWAVGPKGRIAKFVR
jgi:photosystem II stability/assembly factor-like uncharacterized protein